MIFTLQPIKYHPWAKVSGQYDRTSVGLSPWFSRAGVVTTGIPEKRLRELEKGLGYKEGTLSPDSPFLDTYQFKISSGKASIDTDTPSGALAYEFLMNHPLVAKDLQSVQPRHSFVLKNEDAEAKVKNLKNQTKLDAMDAYKKLTAEDMRRALRVLGKKSDSISPELVRSMLYTMVDENPEEFIEKWVKNADKDYEFILESAVAAGVIIRNKSNYKYGSDSIGTSKQDAIDYLKEKTNADLLNVITLETKSKLSI